jgi:two-component system, chemotaxis family, protein-glutamate methylesterase/glutaminase
MTAALLDGREITAIAIGASAGGIEALTVLLPAFTANTAIAVFLVLHQLRGRRSALVEVLQPLTVLRVREPEDKEPIAAATIYVAPPDYHLLIEAGPSVALSVDAPVHYSRPSIDVLFESAAEVYGPHLLGMLLTGANDDGAEGLATVRRRGGATMVQRPEQAHSPYMIESALARGPVDAMLSLGEMADLLRHLTVSA